MNQLLLTRSVSSTRIPDMTVLIRLGFVRTNNRILVFEHPVGPLAWHTWLRIELDVQTHEYGWIVFDQDIDEPYDYMSQGSIIRNRYQSDIASIMHNLREHGLSNLRMVKNSDE